MATFTEDERRGILKHRLRLELKEVRESLLQIEEAFPGNWATSRDWDEYHYGLKNTISNLVQLLLKHPVAKILSFKWTDQPLSSELAYVFIYLESDEFDLSLFSCLLECIENDSNDDEIWKSVGELVIYLPRRIFTRGHSDTVLPTYGGLPSPPSTCSTDSEQTSSNFERPIIEQLITCTYRDVGGFWEKYFKNKPWSKKCEKIFEEVKGQHVDGSWIDLPKALVETEVWQWLKKFQGKHLCDAPNVYLTMNSTAEMNNTEHDCQIDIMVRQRPIPVVGKHDINDIQLDGELVVGVVNKDGNWRRNFTHLALSVSDVFSNQPTRRFVPGFMLWGTELELWIFDRSGAYSSNIFNVHKEPERFVTAMVGYAHMSDEELGLSTFINIEGGQSTIAFKDEATSEDVSYELEEQPIARQRSIISRGTACYLTTDRKFIAKFSSHDGKCQPERYFYRLIEDHDVKGVPRLISFCRLGTIAQQRAGLTFLEVPSFQDFLRWGTRSFGSQSARDTDTLSIKESSSSSAKRKRGAEARPSVKKTRSNSQRSKLSREVQVDSPSQDASSQQSSATPEKFRFRENFLHVIYPAGRPLTDAESPVELLKTFRDAIKAHRSLLLDAHILHRDISDNNIIITKPEENNGMTGMLIDFDLAVLVDEKLKNERTRAEFMTGTRKFMAIEVLEAGLEDPPNKIDSSTSHRISNASRTRKEPIGIDRTYRHDLESFFYVFLSTCMTYGWGEKTARMKDPFMRWYIGSCEDNARTKRGDMESSGFKKYILRKFSPKFEELQGLARTLRNLLFGEGQLFTSTREEHPSVLYDKIISVFEDAIKEMECRTKKQPPHKDGIEGAVKPVDHLSVSKIMQQPSNLKRKAEHVSAISKRRRLSHIELSSTAQPNRKSKRVLGDTKALRRSERIASKLSQKRPSDRMTGRCH